MFIKMRAEKPQSRENYQDSSWNLGFQEQGGNKEFTKMLKKMTWYLKLNNLGKPWHEQLEAHEISEMFTLHWFKKKNC